MPDLMYEPTRRTKLRPVSEGGEIFSVGDTLRGVASGVEGFGRSVVGLADWATGDRLPDSWSEDRWIDRPTTMIGGFAEGLTQFGLGFYSAGLGWAGRLGAAVKLGQVSKGVALAAGVGRQAVADFVAFDGHEGRLSNLLESLPELKNPVTEYLAADKDDEELEGRLKNVVEGRLVDLGMAGVGRIFGMALKGYKKGVAAFKKARIEGFDEEVALQRARDAAYDPKATEEMAHAYFDDAPDPVVNPPKTLVGETDPKLDPRVWGTDADLKRGTNDVPVVTQTADEIRQRTNSNKAAEAHNETVWKDINGTVTEAEADGLAGQLTKALRPDIAPANVPVVRGFINRLGSRLFGDLDVLFPETIRKGKTADGPVAGRMNFAKRVVEIADNAIENGSVADTMLHELWHSSERYLPAEDVVSFRAEFNAERAKFIASGAPGAQQLAKGEPLSSKAFDHLSGADRAAAWEQAYSFTNVSEYFAVNMTQRTLTELSDKHPLLRFGRGWLANLGKAFGQKFGASASNQLFDRFINGHMKKAEVQRMGGMANYASLDSVKPSDLKSLADAVDEVNKRVGEVTRSIASEGEEGVSKSDVLRDPEALQGVLTDSVERLLNARHLANTDGEVAVLRAIETVRAKEIASGLGNTRRAMDSYGPMAKRTAETLKAMFPDGEFASMLDRYEQLGKASVEAQMHAYTTLTTARAAVSLVLRKATEVITEIKPKLADPKSLTDSEIAAVLRQMEMFYSVATNVRKAIFINGKQFRALGKRPHSAAVSALNNALKGVKEGAPEAAAKGADAPLLNEAAQAVGGGDVVKGPAQAGDLLTGVEAAKPAEVDPRVFEDEAVDAARAEDQAAKDAVKSKPVAAPDEAATGGASASDGGMFTDPAAVKSGGGAAAVSPETPPLFNQAAQEVGGGALAPTKDEGLFSPEAKEAGGGEEFQIVTQPKVMDPEVAARLKRAKANQTKIGALIDELGISDETAKGIISRYGSREEAIKFLTALQSFGDKEEMLAKLFSGAVDKTRAAWAASGGDLAKFQKSLRRAAGERSGSDMLVEYYMNALLSGPKTAVVNGFGGAITYLWRPLELALGGSFKALRSMDARHLLEPMVYLTKAMGDVGDAFRIARAAFKAENPQLLGDVSDVLEGVRAKAISAAGAGVSPDSVKGKALDTLGRFIRLPSATLTATDEFWKQLNFRSEARVQAFRDAIHKGGTLAEARAAANGIADKLVTAEGRASTMARFVDEARAELSVKPELQDLDEADMTALVMDDARNRYQAFRDSSLATIQDNAQAWAEEATFTRRLGNGNMVDVVGRSIQDFMSRFPLMRPLLPFVRTPINILKFAYDRADVPGFVGVMSNALSGGRLPQTNVLYTRLVKDIAAGGDAKADALARMAFGISTAATVVMLAGNGQITGSGPANRAQRNALEATGWLPYSLKIGDRYVSYARLDPIATLLGLTADISDLFGRSPESLADQTQAMFAGLAAGFTNNMTRKSYMVSLAEVLDAIQDPLARVPRMLNRIVAPAAVPTFIAQTSTSDDPWMRELRGLKDEINARLGDETLDVKRDALGAPIKRRKSLGSESLGESANFLIPLDASRERNSPVRSELARLQHGLMPPKDEYGGVDVRSFKAKNGSAYERWLELHQEVKIDGRGIEDALQRLVSSKEYAKLPDQVDGSAGLDSPKVAAINSIIGRYRRKAFDKLQAEVPELRQEYRRVQKARIRR